jgi:hypothetical protein
MVQNGGDKRSAKLAVSRLQVKGGCDSYGKHSSHGKQNFSVPITLYLFFSLSCQFVVFASYNYQ